MVAPVAVTAVLVHEGVGWRVIFLVATTIGRRVVALVVLLVAPAVGLLGASGGR